MRIGFDFDGIVSHTPLRRIMSFVGRRLGKAYRHVVSTVRPNWWAIQLIHELEAEGHEVVIITGTPKMFAPERSAWMERHGIGQLAVYYNPKPDFSTKQQIVHKVRAIGRLGVKVFVEDQPRVAKGIARLAKVEVVLHVGQPKETAKEVRAAIRDASKAGAGSRGGKRRGRNPEAPSPPREYVMRDGRTSLGEVKTGDFLEVYYPATGIFFKVRVLSEPMAKGGIWYIEVQDKAGDRQGAVWHGSYFVLGQVGGVENPRPQIVISVPHAIGMPVTGRMKGHDYIAEEMARKLAERLSAHPLFLVVGDIPRDVLDLNRERARWKTNFRQVVREAIRRDPQNTIHLDVHSFRVGSKVYAGNDIAIVTTEKRARPYEIALRDHLLANGVRCRIYTEMLMDVVPEGRELGVAVSYLLEFNEGSTPEQKERYADLVSDFILRAVSSWPPEWPSLPAEVAASKETEPQANPDNHFPLEPSLTRNPCSSRATSRTVSLNHRSHSSSLIANKYAPPDINSLPAEANPATLPAPTESEMHHEHVRIDEMNERQLFTRLGRMTIPQKVYAFYIALEHARMSDLRSAAKAKLAALGYDEEGRRIKPRSHRIPITSQVNLVPWSNLHIGDLVEVPQEFSQGPERFTVVYRLGVLRDEDEPENIHGEENSVWGIWERTAELAERKYRNATDGDLRPFLPGLLKHNSDEGIIYRVLRTGIWRPQDNRTKIEMLEGKGAPIRDGQVEMYYAVPSGLTPPYGTLEPNFEYSEGEVILVSTHPEIGLQLGGGLVLPVKVPVAHLSFLREYPHRADFQLGAPEESWPLEPADFLGEPFNVRAVGLVRGNPECVLCTDLQTPKVYYQDPFVIICEDIKDEQSILGMTKRHAKEPEEWEHKWLLRVLNFYAGEVFPHEFEIVKTMNTEPAHFHVHAKGNSPPRERSTLEIINSLR